MSFNITFLAVANSTSPAPGIVWVVTYLTYVTLKNIICAKVSYSLSAPYSSRLIATRPALFPTRSVSMPVALNIRSSHDEKSRSWSGVWERHAEELRYWDAPVGGALAVLYPHLPVCWMKRPFPQSEQTFLTCTSFILYTYHLKRLLNCSLAIKNTGIIEEKRQDKTFLLSLQNIYYEMYCIYYCLCSAKGHN